MKVLNCVHLRSSADSKPESTAQRDNLATLMKVLILGPNFAPELVGVGRYTADFAAWLGLVPRQHATGGKPRQHRWRRRCRSCG